MDKAAVQFGQAHSFRLRHLPGVLLWPGSISTGQISRCLRRG